MLGDLDLRNDEAASAVLSRFDIVGALRYVQTSESAVYSVSGESEAYLRMIPDSHRTRAQIEAELDFVNFLGNKGMRVARPIPSKSSHLVEEVQTEDKVFLCTMFQPAPGRMAIAFSAEWNESLFFRWGQFLGRLHLASGSYEGSGRWSWYQEPAFGGLGGAAREELDEIQRNTPPTGAPLGLIHGDLGRTNFHVDDDGQLTAFDFDDCCYHFFEYDIAVALWPLRKQSRDGKGQYLGWMLDGYTSERVLDDNFEDRLMWMFRLRSIFMFAYHSRKWGSDPPEERQKWLNSIASGFGQPVW